MLLECNITLAWRCPICGELDLDKISIFDFSGKKRLAIKCGCGFDKITFGKTEAKKYWVEYSCAICDSVHRQFYTRSQFWNKKIKKIKCLDNRAELGYIGSYDKVEKLAKEEEECLRLMLDKLEFEDYFNNPDIMLSILNRLHDIAADGGLICQCGSVNIDIDMLPKEISLTCTECEGTTKIKAETKKDLAFLRKINQIKIIQGVVTALESINI